MKVRQILLSALLCATTAALKAQDALPQNYSITLGGGLMLPRVEGGKNAFFEKNGNRAGYDLMAEYRYYFLPTLSAGLQYDYLNSKHSPDKMHLHFIRPNITLRHLWSNGCQGAFASLGVGYMDYQERIYQKGIRGGNLYQKGYCGVSFALGYEFSITPGISGVMRADILAADWFANPDRRLFNPDGYDDGVNHSWYKNNLTFINLGVALQFGR